MNVPATEIRSLRSILASQASAAANPHDPLEHERQRLEAEALECELRFRQAQDAGYRKGMEDAEATIAAAITDAKSAVIKEHDSHAQALAAQEVRLDELAVSLAEKIAQMESMLPETVAELTCSSLGAVLRDLHGQEPLVSRLVTEMIESRRARPATLFASPGDIGLLASAASMELKLEPDPALAPGACRLEDAYGNFETSLEVRLEAVNHALLELVAASQARRR